MSGKVPPEEMDEERVELLERAADVTSGMSKSHMLALIALLAGAAQQCPRIGCATCSFMAKHEAGQLPVPD